MNHPRKGCIRWLCMSALASVILLTAEPGCGARANDPFASHDAISTANLNYQSRRSFTPLAGATYQIAVNGFLL